MLRALYDWTMNLAANRHADKALAFISFIESSVFPIPPDALLIPMVLSERAKAWWYAFVCTVASVLGALLGYVIGALLFEAVGQPILNFYGYQDKFEAFASLYNKWGFLIVLAGGITILPYKLITIASGATGMPLFVFTLSSIVARSVRFYAVAALVYYFGPPVREFIEKRLALVATLSFAALVGGFVLIKYLF